MGMFDTVKVPCPSCGEGLEFQSKEGDCELNEYTLDSAPLPIALDLFLQNEVCTGCGKTIELEKEFKIVAKIKDT